MSERTPRPFGPGQERVMHVLLRAMSAANTWLFRASGGRLGSRFPGGAPLLLLTSVGARSARRHTTPLIYLASGDELVLVASKAGSNHHPAWYHNLMKNPEARVQIGAEERNVQARRASPEEKAALWPRLVELYSDFADYQARTPRDIPVIILSPSV